MEPNFEDQVRRLLRRYAEPVTPTRDTSSQVRARLAHPARGRHPGRGGWRAAAFPLAAFTTALMIAALFATLFQVIRGSGGNFLSCPPSATPTSSPVTSSSNVPFAGGTLQITHAYVGDDFIEVSYRLTGMSGDPFTGNLPMVMPMAMYVRDAAGHYAVVNGGQSWREGTDRSVISGSVVLPAFASPEPAGKQTFYLGWSLPHSNNNNQRSPVETAFSAVVVNGTTSRPVVAPSTANGVTLELIDMTVNATPSPLLSPAMDSVRLHLRLDGLPAAPSCSTQVIASFHSRGGPLITVDNGATGGPGTFINGDQSTLTFPDGTNSPPVFAAIAGRPYLSSGFPQVYSMLLQPGDPGEMDMVMVFYTPHLPDTGTITFALNELHASYVWIDANGAASSKSHEQDHNYTGPWKLAIPLTK